MPLMIQKGGGIRRNNTTIHDIDGIVVVTLHNTRIFTYNRKTCTAVLNTGGWNTPTTIRRMNECLHEYGFHNRVCKADFTDRTSLAITE